MFEGVETSVVQGLERVFRIFAVSPDWWGFRAFHQGLFGVLGKGCEYAGRPDRIKLKSGEFSHCKWASCFADIQG